VLAHFKSAQLLAAAEEAGALEAKALYLGAAARLARELSRTIQTLINYRDALGRRAARGPTPGRTAGLPRGKSTERQTRKQRGKR
jgi:hypothetical protein